MQFEALFFDLDGTLYPHGSGIWTAISVRMNTYMHEKLGIPVDEVSAIREEYFHKFGTTLRGVQNNYEIDSDEYLNYVHDIPVHEFLKRDEKLLQILKSNKLPKWIVTNSDQNHSERVLSALGIANQFEGIIGMRKTNFIPKPNLSFFEAASKISGFNNPQSIVFFDDIPKNIVAGNKYGYKSVIVGKNGTKEYKYHIDSIHDFPKTLEAISND